MMDVYLFKHKYTNTVYIRCIRDPRRIPTGMHRDRWILDSLYQILFFASVEENQGNDVYEHLVKNGMTLGGEDRRDWKQEWTYELVKSNLNYEDQMQYVTSLIVDLLKQGCFVLNRSPFWKRAVKQLNEALPA